MSTRPSNVRTGIPGGIGKVKKHTVARAVSRTQDVVISNEPPSPTEDRSVVLERELERAARRGDARGKEAKELRKRVQELEPEVQRLGREVIKLREAKLASRSPRKWSPRYNPTRRNRTNPQDACTPRDCVKVDENRMHILEARCLKLEQENNDLKVTATSQLVQEKADLFERQLAIAERKVQNSLYIREAHEGLAAQAVAREREAEARASEYGRRLDRVLEKLEAIEQRECLVNLDEACRKDEDKVHATEGEIRAYYLDPDLNLPVSTAQRRGLARAEQRLLRLRSRLSSETERLSQLRSQEALHEELRTAASCGDIAATHRLLATGVSVNVPDKCGFSAFLYSCGQSNAELVRLMLEAGGDVHDGNGSITALIIAAKKGNKDVVEALLEGGADVIGQDSAGGTALHAAAVHGHEDIIRLLLEAGADINCVDQGGNTTLHMVARAKSLQAIEGGSGRATVIAMFLLEWGASANIKNSEDLTPLSAALAARNQSVVLAFQNFYGEMNPVQGMGKGTIAQRSVELVSTKLQGTPVEAQTNELQTEQTISGTSPFDTNIAPGKHEAMTNAEAALVKPVDLSPVAVPAPQARAENNVLDSKAKQLESEGSGSQGQG